MELSSGPQDPFHHQPLDLSKPTIRIIQLLPGTGVLSCRIKQIELDSRYTAVSYVWGVSEPDCVILMDGRPFHIRNNLQAFLLQMRHNGLWAPLWIDALCIDQANIPERNQQVRQMASIFSNAQEVISWLGTGDQSVAYYLRIAADASQEVAEKKAARQNTSRTTDETILFYLATHRRRFPEHNKFELSAAAFVKLDYFRRTWVIQEVYLATKAHRVVYGDISLAWADLKLFVSNSAARLTNYEDEIPILSLIEAPSFQAKIEDSKSAIALISKFAKTRCSDPRDHIFSLRMLWNIDQFPIEVDYSLSCTSLFLKLIPYILTSAALPIPNFGIFLDMLELKPDDFTTTDILSSIDGAQKVILPIVQSREIRAQEILPYPDSSRALKKVKPTPSITSHDIYFCPCKDCIPLSNHAGPFFFRGHTLQCSDRGEPAPKIDQNDGTFSPLLIQITAGTHNYFGLAQNNPSVSPLFTLAIPKLLNNEMDPIHIVEAEQIGGVGVLSSSISPSSTASLSQLCFSQLYAYVRRQNDRISRFYRNQASDRRLGNDGEAKKEEVEGEEEEKEKEKEENEINRPPLAPIPDTCRISDMSYALHSLIGISLSLSLSLAE